MNTPHPPSSTQTLCMLQWWRKLCHHVQQLRPGKEMHLATDDGVADDVLVEPNEHSPIILHTNTMHATVVAEAVSSRSTAGPGKEMKDLPQRADDGADDGVHAVMTCWWSLMNTPHPPFSTQTLCMLQWWRKLCHHVQQLRPGKEMEDLPRGADDGVHAVMTCWWSLMNTPHPPSSTQTLCMLQWWRKLCRHVQ